MDISDHRRIYKSSQFVGNWIKKQPYVKEETLTDWLLFDLSENIEGIHYMSFPRSEEARRTKADWEWWLIFSDFCFTMRIQAKKLYSTYDNYPGIAYTNMYGLQIEKLLNDAKEGDFMPFYAFYTDQRSDVMCPNKRNNEGVFIAGAQKIYDTFISGPRTPVMAADILRNTLSLSCFVCCPLVSEGENWTRPPGDPEGAQRWIGSIMNYYKSELGSSFSYEGASIPGHDSLPGMHYEMPDYIRSFVDQSKKTLPDRWEQDFSDEIEGVNALLVYDLRQ